MLHWRPSSKCRYNKCPAHEKCVFLQTDIFPNNGKVHVLFTGQGGGKTEKEKERPFVGASGQRLKKQILTVFSQLKRSYGIAFGNTILDCPEGNRVPNSKELKYCKNHYNTLVEYLTKKYDLQFIVVLGKSAQESVIESTYTDKISKIRGKVFFEKFGEIITPVIPTYHPAGLLHNKIKWDPTNLHNFDILMIEDITKAFTVDIEKEKAKSTIWKGYDTDNVASTNIEKIGYDEESNTLRVLFKSGGAYEYYNVKSTIKKELTEHKSPGSFFYHNIRGKYEYKKLELKEQTN